MINLRVTLNISIIYVHSIIFFFTLTNTQRMATVILIRELISKVLSKLSTSDCKIAGNFFNKKSTHIYVCVHVHTHIYITPGSNVFNPLLDVAPPLYFPTVSCLLLCSSNQLSIYTRIYICVCVRRHLSPDIHFKKRKKNPNLYGFFQFSFHVNFYLRHNR